MASSWEWHAYFCWGHFTPYRPILCTFLHTTVKSLEWFLRLYSEWGNFSSLYGAYFKVSLVDLRFLGIKTNLKNLWTLKKKAILSPKKWVLIWSSGPFYSSGFLRGPHKFDEISQLIWHLLSKIQINWEISSNFCGPLRKPEL